MRKEDNPPLSPEQPRDPLQILDQVVYGAFDTRTRQDTEFPSEGGGGDAHDAGEQNFAAPAPSGSAIVVDHLQPWPEPVDGATVLNDVGTAIHRYIVMTPHDYTAATLWTAHAHCYEAFMHSPRLAITSPERECGKTTLTDILKEFCPRPLMAENLTPAVLFRVVEKHKPTLFVDEYDTFIHSNGELVGLLNAGHRRGGNAFRCVGDSHDVRAFNVFAPVTLSGIRALPGPLRNRSITIALRRAKPDELARCVRFDSRHVEHEQELARKLARWSADNYEYLCTADPDMGRLHGRVADNWRPLFAIADAAGGPWPQRVREAAAALSDATRDENELGIELLADVRDIFQELHTDRIHSATLVGALNAREGRPWGEMRNEKGISQHTLARLLAPYKIRPRQIWIPETNRQGYLLENFRDAFERYLRQD